MVPLDISSAYFIKFTFLIKTHCFLVFMKQPASLFLFETCRFFFIE